MAFICRVFAFMLCDGECEREKNERDYLYIVIIYWHKTIKSYESFYECEFVHLSHVRSFESAKAYAKRLCMSVFLSCGGFPHFNPVYLFIMHVIDFVLIDWSQFNWSQLWQRSVYSIRKEGGGAERKRMDPNREKINKFRPSNTNWVKDEAITFRERKKEWALYAQSYDYNVIYV